MYHAISSDGEGTPPLTPGERMYAVDESEFRGQMSQLERRNYRSVTVTDILANPDFYQMAGRNVVLTFDDGFASDCEIAATQLQSKYYHGNFFITTDYVGKDGYMDWSGIRNLSDAGHIIGSHCVTHGYLSEMSDDDAAEELVRSRKIIEDRTGRQVVALSLPGGRGGMRIVRLAKRTGYLAVCTSDPGAGTVEDGFLVLNRIPVKRTTSLKSFNSIIEFSRHSRLRDKLLHSSKHLASRLLGNRRYDALREKVLRMF